MRSDLHWQALLPRVLLLVVGLLAMQYALGLAVRSKVHRAGEAVVGAPVDVAHARVSLVDRQVELSGLRVANPNNPRENLIETDRADFHFALGPLLRKQTVVEYGMISGIRLATPRDPSKPSSSPHTVIRARDGLDL